MILPLSIDAYNLNEVLQYSILSQNWAERSGGLKPRPFRTAFAIVK